MRWLAVALLLAGCGTTVTPSSASQTPLASPIAVSTPFPPPPRFTLAPTPVPTPSPTAVPALPPAHTVSPPAPASRPVRSPSHPDVNWLVGPGISVHVGVYTDCTGKTWQVGVARYACVLDRIYLQGHNPGAFSPVAHYGLGVVLTYWDGAGVAHRLTIIGRRIWLRAKGVPPLLPGAGSELQTCATGHPDGSVDVILDAAVT